MPYKFQYKEYLFFHGSFNHNKSIVDNNETNFAHDYTASNYVKKSIKENTKIEFTDNYIFVGAHNYGNKKPIVHPKYLMLGGGAPDEVCIVELNSRTASAVGKNKTKMRKFSLKVVE
jgi:hypothetical protein